MNTPASHLAADASARLPAAAPARPWEVARWGRLLAGAATLAFTALGLLHHPAWLLGTLGVSFQLVLTALTDRCPLRDTLLKLGCKEREDLFEPGGDIRK